MSLSEWGAIEESIRVVRNLDFHGKHHFMSARKNGQDKWFRYCLFDDHPWLRFTKEGLGVANEAIQLKYRILIWKEAHVRAGTSLSDLERALTDNFDRFMRAYEGGTYFHLLERFDVSLSDDDIHHLRRTALCDLSKHMTELTWYALTGEQERQRREVWALYTLMSPH